MTKRCSSRNRKKINDDVQQEIVLRFLKVPAFWREMILNFDLRARMKNKKASQIKNKFPVSNDSQFPTRVVLVLITHHAIPRLDILSNVAGVVVLPSYVLAIR